MARIRTIKPEFFKHEELFELEKETGLPMRLAFIGLWTAADKEGRFKWRPRQLGTDILPYDGVDFADALSSLHRHGYIVRYEVEGESYGFVANWHKHQRPRRDEQPSNIPGPSCDTAISCATDTSSSLFSYEPSAAQCIGNRERKGIYISVKSTSRKKIDSDQFTAWWKAYPRKVSKGAARKAWASAIKKLTAGGRSEADAVLVLYEACHRYAEQCKSTDKQFIAHPSTWLNGERWDDEPVEPESTSCRVPTETELKTWTPN